MIFTVIIGGINWSLSISICFWSNRRLQDNISPIVNGTMVIVPWSNSPRSNLNKHVQIYCNENTYSMPTVRILYKYLTQDLL